MRQRRGATSSSRGREAPTDAGPTTRAGRRLGPSGHEEVAQPSFATAGMSRAPAEPSADRAPQRAPAFATEATPFRQGRAVEQRSAGGGSGTWKRIRGGRLEQPVIPAKAGIPAGERQPRSSPPGAPAFAGATRYSSSLPAVSGNQKRVTTSAIATTAIVYHRPANGSPVLATIYWLMKGRKPPK